MGHNDVETFDVAIIGSGFGGIAAAARLRQSGVSNLVVLEEASSLGGTWRENTYPGCACDVPSTLYSLSYAPNPDWTRMYAGHTEIETYLRRTAKDLGIDQLIRFNTRLDRGRWSESESCWELDTSAGPLRAKWVVAGCGPLHHPVMPDLPGLDRFKGTVFHSARWNHDHDLTGRRVAVLGTGASAIQFVPQIQPRVDELVLLQRTAQWVLPKPDRKIGQLERTLYRRLPAAQRVARQLTHAAFEFGTFGVRHPWLLRPLERLARANMHRHIKDPDLRRRMSVRYAMGCKRILLSNSWFQALAQPNVTVRDGRVREVRATSIVDGEGTEHQIDTLILATGYHASSPPVADLFYDADGISMAKRFAASGARAYLGTTVTGFPNLFLLTGPNSFVYSSIVDVIEAQVDHIAQALAFARNHKIARLEISADVEAAFNDELQKALSKTVWASGCSSWFLDFEGRNTTMWPWSTAEFRRRTRRFDPAAYAPTRHQHRVDAAS